MKEFCKCKIWTAKYSGLGKSIQSMKEFCKCKIWTAKYSGWGKSIQNVAYFSYIK